MKNAQRHRPGLIFTNINIMSYHDDMKTLPSWQQEANELWQSSKYQRLYTDFLSEGLIFAHYQAHYRVVKIEKN